jgi:AsmA protein
MSKPIKIALAALLGLLALLLVALLALVLLVDPNRFKPQLIAAVQQQTGRELRIDGELGWSFYPVLGIEIGRAELANAAGFGAEPMLGVERVAVGVELLPLFSGVLNVTQLRLERPVIHLAKDARGRSNWDDILEHREALAAGRSGAASAEDKRADDTEPGGELRVAVSGLTLVEAALHWRDAQSGQQLRLAPIDLKTSAIHPGEPVAIALSLAAASAQPALQGEVKLATLLTAADGFEAFAWRDLELEVTATGESLPSGSLTATLRGDGDIDLQRQTLSLPALVISVAGAQLRATIEGQQIIDAPRFSGRVEAAPLSLRTLLTDLKIELPEMADGSALQRVALRGEFSATPQRVAVDPLQVEIDDSVLRGRLDVRLGEVTRLGVDLQLDRIDLDRYLPADAPAETPAAKPQGAPSSPPAAQQEPVDLAVLDTLALDGRIAIAELRVRHLDLRDVALTVKSSGRRVTLDPLTAALYGGQADIRIDLDARGTTAKTAVRSSLRQVQVGALLDAWLQRRGPIEGSGNLNGDFTFAGLDTSAMLASLSGAGELRLADGAVRGVNVAQEIRNALALVRRQPRQQAAQSTDFTELVLPFRVADGVISWSQLSASSPLLRVGSNGSLRLLDLAVDSKLDVTIVQSLKGQGGEPLAELAELAGLLVPVTLRGPVGDPKIAVDLVRVLEQTRLGAKKEALEAELREKAKTREDELKEKAAKELQRGLDRLFRAPRSEESAAAPAGE